MNDTNEIDRAHAVVHARVQQVSLRLTDLHDALTLRLSGRVRNLSDSPSETFVEGDKSAHLLLFVHFLKSGPSNTSVARVDCDRGPTDGQLQGFEIRHCIA